MYDVFGGDACGVRQYKLATKNEFEAANLTYRARRFEQCIALCETILLKYPNDLAPKFADAKDVLYRLKAAKRAARLERHNELPESFDGVDNFKFL